MVKLEQPPEHGERYYYLPWKGVGRPFVRVFVSASIAVVTPILLFGIIVNLIPLLTGEFAFRYLVRIATMMWGALVITLILSATFLMGRDIVVSQEGVWVEVQRGKGLFLDRGALSSAKIFPVPFLDLSGRRPSFTDTSYAVHVDSLTPFHRLIGLMHGLWLRPVFIVTPDHENYETLLERIRRMLVSEGGE